MGLSDCSVLLFRGCYAVVLFDSIVVRVGFGLALYVSGFRDELRARASDRLARNRVEGEILENKYVVRGGKSTQRKIGRQFWEVSWKFGIDREIYNREIAWKCGIRGKF